MRKSCLLEKKKQFKDMTYDGIFRSLNLRIDVLDKEIEYLYEVNPLEYEGAETTVNGYANGMMHAHREEKKFLISLLRLMVDKINKGSEKQ
jgi:hypothetical protein